MLSSLSQCAVDRPKFVGVQLKSSRGAIQEHAFASEMMVVSFTVGRDGFENKKPAVRQSRGMGGRKLSGDGGT
jgi:hypothetical protein